MIFSLLDNFIYKFDVIYNLVFTMYVTKFTLETLLSPFNSGV